MIYMNQRATQRIELPGDEVAYIIRELWGVPLYAYYVVLLEVFQPDEIEGTLMTQPFDIAGPFTSEEEAVNYIKPLDERDTKVDKT